MRRRRGRHWLLSILLWTWQIGPAIPAQTETPPVALSDPLDRLASPPPPAPQPIPGPASMDLPVGGMDETVPQGLPINLATAMQLSGVRPLDIATATAQVQQALALQLQAKVLWVPNLNAGVNYYPARRRPAELLPGSGLPERYPEPLRWRWSEPVRGADRRDLRTACGPTRRRLTSGGPPECSK